MPFREMTRDQVWAAPILDELIPTDYPVRFVA